MSALLLCLAASVAIGGPIRDLAPGMWYEIPNSKLRSVTPSSNPGGDPTGIVDAWGGAAYDTDREQLIVWGGGHVDYAGNEVYTFGSMTSETPTWVRRSDPSPAQTGCTATYADGKPRSTHTYNTLAYDPNTQKLVSMGLGSVWNCGSESAGIFAFSMVNHTWDAASAHPATNGGAQGSSASYDSLTGLIWRRGNLDRALQSFRVSTNTLSNYDDGLGKMNIDFSTALDPQRRIMVAVGGYNGVGPLDDGSANLLVWDLASPGRAWKANTSGGSTVEGQTKLGFEFHPPTGTFIAWFGGTDVWRLTPPTDLRNGTWQWSRVTAAAGSPTPGSENARGTYGRWRYIPSLDVFMVLNSIDRNVFVYRLSNGTGVTQPTINFSANPSTVGAQGSSTLSWTVTNADSCTASGGWTGTRGLTGSESVGPLASSTTYVLGCSNTGGGSASRSVTVTVDSGAPAPIVTLDANPTSITSGQTSVLSWTSSNATACSATGGWTGNKATQGSQTIGPLTATTTYTLTCTGTGGSGADTATVTVGQAPPAPTVDLTANPLSVTSGGSSTLTWSSTNATACTASGGWSGSKATSGTQAVSGLTSTRSFTLQCTGTGGSGSDSVTVTVTAASAPTVDLTANPTSVTSGGSSTLTWSSTNATACTASGGWSGSKATSGTQAVSGLTSTRSFTLQCTGTGGSGSDSVTVTVTATPAPTVNLAANPTSVNSGESSTLTWSSTNATSCTASGGWSGTKATSGNQTINGLTSTTTFTLRCTGGGGATSRSATVNVAAAPGAPTLTLTADPTTVNVNASSQLTWSTTNVTTCTASGAWSGAKSPSGTQATGALSNTASYTLSCSGAGGNVERTVIVTVNAGGGGGGGGGSTDEDSSGGGSMSLNALAFLAFIWLLSAARRNPLPRARSAGSIARGIGVLSVALLLGTGCITTSTLAGDVASFRVTNNSGSAQTNVPVTLGYAFRPGDFASGAGMGARLSSGQTLTLQVDKKATHTDGSLRHGIVSVRLPSLPASGSETVILTTDPSGSVPPTVTLPALLASGFNAQVNLTIGAQTYTASAANLLAGPRVIPWLAGPVASEWIVGGPVRDSAGNAHPHLAAYFHVRAYTGLDAVRVDVVIENNWSYVPSPGNFTYNVAISVGGQSRYTQSGLQHYHHARWHKVFWWGISEPPVNVQHDKAYLVSTKVVPRYLPLTPTSSFLANLTTSVAPMSNGSMEDFMPSGGPSSSIGPLPAWSTAYVLSEDNRARLSTLANGDAGGAYSIHFRNDRTTDPSFGYPISIIDRPSAGYGSGGDFPMGGSSPYTADTAHQPSVAYFPYLITGDYFYLEELQFWVDFNWLGDEISVGCRSQAQGILRCHQERGQAWALRELARAAFITPDDHPLKSYFTTGLENNRQWYTDAYVNGTIGTYKNPFGAIDRGSLGTDSGRQETKTWMDDFFTWSVGHVMELGFGGWRPLFDFKAKFVLGRLATSDFCYILSGSDTVALASSARAAWFSDWATVYNTSFPSAVTGTSCGSQAMANAITAMEGSGYEFSAGEIYNWASLAGSRLAIMHAASAILNDYGVAGGDVAWARVRSSTVQPDWTEFQNFAVQPRGTVAPPPPPNPAPTLTLSANPTSIQPNQNSTLTWSTQNATGCTASGGWSGSKATSGTQAVGPLTTSTSYSLQCTGSGGSVSRSVTVTVASTTPPAPTVDLTANPLSVTSGGSSTLTWSSTNATACTASGGWSGSKATSGTQAVSGLTSTRSFTLQCTGTGGSGSDSVTVTVTAPGAPTVDLTANPTSVTSGGSSTLTWSSTNATACTASGGWSGSKATSGTQAVSGLTSTRSFTLQCTGTGGSGSDSVTVTVTATPAPTVNLAANPTSVNSGESSTLTWSSTNATSCTASGGWSGTKATSGNQTINGLTSTTTFTLRCTGGGGATSRSATVNVAAAPGAPTLTLAADPTTVNVNASSQLTWSTTNVTTCTASGAWSGAKSPSGTQATGALSNTASYTLSCSGAGGNVERTVIVTVNAGGGGGGGGGSTGDDSSGGGAVDLYWLAVLALLMFAQYAGHAARARRTPSPS